MLLVAKSSGLANLHISYGGSDGHEPSQPSAMISMEVALVGPGDAAMLIREVAAAVASRRWRITPYECANFIR